MIPVTHTRRSIVHERRYAKANGQPDPAGDCLFPISRAVRGLPDKVSVGLGIERDAPSFVMFDVRCRTCSKCLEHRRRLWTARAIAETQLSVRTWFGTLTVRPTDRVKMTYKADLLVSEQRCEPWSCLTSSEQFQKIAEVITPELTLFLKRLRKSTGAGLRYLLVSEAHEDGFPHYHLLVHEFAGTVTKSKLESAWTLGFSHWRLVDRNHPAQVGYVCKYLSKSALTRVRASQSYGQPPSRLLAERLEEIASQLAKAKAGV